MKSMGPIKLLNYSDRGVPIYAQMVQDRVFYSEIRYFMVYIAISKDGVRYCRGYQVYAEEEARSRLREGSKTVKPDKAANEWDYFERKMGWSR